jgi:hypothetical protein
MSKCMLCRETDNVCVIMMFCKHFHYNNIIIILYYYYYHIVSSSSIVKTLTK